MATKFTDFNVVTSLVAGDYLVGHNAASNGEIRATAQNIASSLATFIRPTWNNGLTTFYGIDLDVTNTASAAASRALRVAVGGVNKFLVGVDGNAEFLSAGSAAVTIGADSNNDGTGATADLLFDNNGGTTVGRIRWDEASTTLNLGYGANNHLSISSGGAINVAGGISINGEGAINTDGTTLALGDGGHTHADIYGIIVANRNNTVTSGGMLLQGQWSGDSTLPMIGSNASGGGLVMGYGVRPKPYSQNAFLSGHGSNLGRSAYIIEGNVYTWWGSVAQTVTEGTDITLTKMATLDQSVGAGYFRLYDSGGSSSVAFNASAGNSWINGGGNLHIGGTTAPNKFTVTHDEATNTWSSVSDASTDAVVKILGSNNATPYGLYLGYANSANNAQGIQAGDGTSALPLLLNPLGGNVSIGTASPNANAILDVSSTTKAFMPPRMTTTQKNAISSPTAGMVVYDSTFSKLAVYTGSAWETVTSV